MKKLLLLTLSWLILTHLWAQSPQGFSYQAVVRNSSDEILANQTVNFRLSITSNDGLTTHYAETSTTATTPQGVANLVIGEGSIVSGVFANIPWESGNLTLKVEVDPTGGTSFSEMGAIPLKSVPYALYAPQSGEVVSTPEALDEDPIFVVRNKMGQIVFAVYQNGVRMYVDESTTKSTRGGFAIGGIGDNLKEGNKYFMVTPDSVRVNLREPVGKNARGGFAIGGIGDNLKAQPSNLFYIGQDSARIYIDTTTNGKNARGGFAIGGIGDNLKANGSEFLRVTKDSTRVYVNSSATKGSRGGFAIGGIGDNLKEQPNSLFYIGQDSARIYIDTTSNTKNARGGFAIGGIGDNLKGKKRNFFDVSTDTTGTINPSQSRVLWYPTKNAFLVGRVLVESRDSVGENSFASGFESKAIGKYSQALGFKARAFGKTSTAIGTVANAIGDGSFALGDSARASGINAYSLGNRSIASGVGSFALGSYYNPMPGQITHFPTQASGATSLALGLSAIASGQNSMAFGIGNTSSGGGSITVGKDNEASNTMSAVFGTYSTASGLFSMSVGNWCTASGMSSYAFGNENSVTADHAYGLGSYNHVDGGSSVCIGSQNRTNAVLGFAMGSATTANSYLSLVFGRYNILAGTWDSWVATDPLFVLGNGTSTGARSNAFTVYKNGSVEMTGAVSKPIKTVTSTQTLDATCYTILANANVTIYLPQASTCNGRVYVIKKITSTAGNVTINAYGTETIDGDLTQLISTQWQKMTVQSNGSSWFIIN